MICVTCMSPAESLFTRYSEDHIQLTDCNVCHNTVDRYVEIDNVVLFIDLLLLKPGAYRHLVFNSLEETLSKYDDWKPLNLSAIHKHPRGTLRRLRDNLRNWMFKYDMINRMWILLLTFEVYLRCISEETKYSKLINEYGAPHLASSAIFLNTSLGMIHKWGSLYQSIYYFFYSTLDILIFHNLTQYIFMSWYRWQPDNKYASSIISYTILLSYGAKIFPVLMLIWPYDTLLTMDIIKQVANLYIIEALRIVTGMSYFTILRVFLFVTVIRVLVVKYLMNLVVTNGNLNLSLLNLCFELQLMVPGGVKKLLMEFAQRVLGSLS